MASQCLTTQPLNHASKRPVITMNQLKSIYNSPSKDLHAHPIQTYFPIIASNAMHLMIYHICSIH